MYTTMIKCGVVTLDHTRCSECGVVHQKAEPCPAGCSVYPAIQSRVDRIYALENCDYSRLTGYQADVLRQANSLLIEDIRDSISEMRKAVSR